MVRQWQQFFYGGRYAATPLRRPDFVKLAEAHGLLGLRVTDRDRLADVVAAGARGRGHRASSTSASSRKTAYTHGSGRGRPSRHDSPASPSSKPRTTNLEVPRAPS